MDLPECPYCYAKVQIWADGLCPACKKDTRTAPPENYQYSVAELTAEQAQPDCCIRCGVVTDNVEFFEYRYDSHLGDRLDENSYLVVLLFCVLTAGIGLFFLPLYRKRLRKIREITYQINLPYCEPCLPHKETFHPLTIEGRVFHYKAHKTYKTRLLELTPAPTRPRA